MIEISELLSHVPHLIDTAADLYARYVPEQVQHLRDFASGDSCTTSAWQKAMDFVRLLNFTSWLGGKFKKQEKGASSHSQNKRSDAPTSALDKPSTKGLS